MEPRLIQFKSLVELREYIKNFDGYKARPIRKGDHPTLYSENDSVNANVQGIRIRDYCFDASGGWVLPYDQKGLSFSCSWQHLSGVYKMFSRGLMKFPDVYWVLSGADLPAGLKFEPDRSISSKQKDITF